MPDYQNSNENKTIGDILLTPTNIYVKEILELIRLIWLPFLDLF